LPIARFAAKIRRMKTLAFVAIHCLFLLMPNLASSAPSRVADIELPPGVREIGARIHGQRADIYLAIDAEFLRGPGLTELWIETLQRPYLDNLADRGVRSAQLWTRPIGRRGAPGPWVPIISLLPDFPSVPRRSYEHATGARPPPPPPGPAVIAGVAVSGFPDGGLAGKRIYISQGHGFTWSTSSNHWVTQRGNTNKLVEDLLNAEAVNHYLVAMLHNAGAQVVTARERDLQTKLTIVDDGDGAAGGYSEQGAFQPGTNPGFKNGLAPYPGQINPFVQGSYRAVPVVKGAPTATASFVPAVPQDGMYAVYLGYVAGQNRVTDAHVEIRHTGGVTHLRVDQQRHGGTWNYLGHFRFLGGIHPDSGAVLLHNDSLVDPAGHYLIADVVRLGGGQGDIVRGNGQPPGAGPVSTRPRWEECSRYTAQYYGAPSTVYSIVGDDHSDDVSTRSRFAAWDHEEGEDSVFVSWHTNAPSPARGTSTYVYGPNAPDGTYQFTGAKDSDKLAKLLQDTIVADCKALWDPTWKDRGVFSAYFGEINPKHNSEMPSVLVEAAFHDTLADADFLREPRFRHSLARSIYKAITIYFAQRDGLPVYLQPEPPGQVLARNLGGGKGRVNWKPGPSGGAYGDAPTGYRVLFSKDGRGFDGGVATTQLSLDFDLPPAGTPLYLRVVATNSGGWSLPSAVMGVVAGCLGPGRALAVQGFTRLDSVQMPVEDLSAWSDGKVQRLRQTRMNRFDHLIEHIDALAAAGLSVDSADRDALPDLSPYALIDWAAGQQSTLDVVWSDTHKKALADYLNLGDGHAILASGSEIAWVIDHKAGPAGSDWLATWFGARYLADDAGTSQLVASANGVLWPGATFDDPEGYEVHTPDVYQLDGGKAVLDYGAGKGVAAVAHATGGAHTVLMGAPIEMVTPAAARKDLFAKLFAVMAVKPDSALCTATTTEGGADAGAVADVASSDAGAAEDAVAETFSPTDAMPDADVGVEAWTGPDSVTLDAHPFAPDIQALSMKNTGKASGSCSTHVAQPHSWAPFLLLGMAMLVLRRRRRQRPRIAAAARPE